MAKTPDVIAKEIIEKIKFSGAGFSCELGTPERKIIDAVAESISEAYIDQYLVGSLLDIESKAGLELEQWVAIFGFGRMQGRKATGTVYVELKNPSPTDINVPASSPFYTRQSLPGSGNPLYFSSTQAMVIPAGSKFAEVPVECTIVGTTGNVPPDSIVYVGDILGTTAVTNLEAFTGGVNVETDDELRQRFKDTFLRNVAGTEDWYLNLAYQNKHVSKAAVFGPIRKYATQLAASNNVNLAQYLTQDVKYAWPGGGHVHVYKDLGQDTEKFYLPGVDFTWSAGQVPQFTWLSGGDIPEGEIVDLEFEYTTRSSRNDPMRGITNKVDMFVNGADPYLTTERTRIVDAVRLTDNPADELWAGNFARVGGGVAYPGNRFMRLGSTPVISFPPTLTIGGQTYKRGEHYHLLRLAPEASNPPSATALLAGSIYETVGIEWEFNGPEVDTGVTVTYTYNRVPEILQAVVKTSKQMTTDVMVHQASYAYIRVHLSVEYDRGFVVSQVDNAIQERLRAYYAGLPFGSWMEISDLTLAAHQVLGVDNVNLTLASEPGVEINYGVHVFANSADSETNPPTPLAIHDTDFKLNDNQLPVFIDAVIRRKANR